jgi:hypothetical protein
MPQSSRVDIVDLYGRIKLGGVNAVAVVEEKSVRHLSCDDFTELLERPKPPWDAV